MENEQQTNKINPIKNETDNLNIATAIKEIEFMIYHTKWNLFEYPESKWRNSNSHL